MFVAHLYVDAIDSETGFDIADQVGKRIDVIGPIFRTYSDAAAELVQELGDVDHYDLPLVPFILEVNKAMVVKEIYQLDVDRREKNGKPSLQRLQHALKRLAQESL